MSRGAAAIGHGLAAFAQNFVGSYQRAQEMARREKMQRDQLALQSARDAAAESQRKWTRGRAELNDKRAMDEASRARYDADVGRLDPELQWPVRSGDMTLDDASRAMPARIAAAKALAAKAAAEKAELDRIRAVASRTSAGASASQAATARKKQRVDAQVKIGNQAGRMQAAARDAKVLPTNSVMAPDAQMQSYNMEVDPGASMRLAEAYDVIPVPPEARPEGGSRSGGINIPDRAQLGQLNDAGAMLRTVRSMASKPDPNGVGTAWDALEDDRKLAMIGGAIRGLLERRQASAPGEQASISDQEVSDLTFIPVAEVTRLRLLRQQR